MAPSSITVADAQPGTTIFLGVPGGGGVGVGVGDGAGPPHAGGPHLPPPATASSSCGANSRIAFAGIIRATSDICVPAVKLCSLDGAKRNPGILRDGPAPGLRLRSIRATACRTPAAPRSVSAAVKVSCSVTGAGPWQTRGERAAHSGINAFSPVFSIPAANCIQFRQGQFLVRHVSLSALHTR